MRQVFLLVLVGFGTCPAFAQLVVQLKPKTLSAFKAYVAQTESSLNERWSGKGNFLEVEDDKAELDQCMRGKIVVRQMLSGARAQVPDGLIHDWRGDVFIPGATMTRVLDVLEDFNKHQAIYPEVAESHLLSRDGHRVQGHWRLQQKGLVPVVLDVDEEADYRPVATGRWVGRAHTRQIVETDMTPFAGGRKFPPDEGHGYLWRLYSYWSLEEQEGGIRAECRTLSLSRDVPSGLGWAVGPYVRKQPQNSLTSTLEHTRNAASR